MFKGYYGDDCADDYCDDFGDNKILLALPVDDVFCCGIFYWKFASLLNTQNHYTNTTFEKK